ncbi:hypothetical protein GCM10010169_25390 [Micromonospora fulviviridis]|uniref:hypothetical protein n=1 Tax=Micromonospora fulviviridis TaxID=47860 RepID=UPI001665C936|nr:hypothetical protein [Micromonospora fulviviridis]GGR80136.1 hypothetical protein GCM10010169_25390 [Micromonospora fulviviridis]
MSRPDRWWRPATRRRPPIRVRQRRTYTEQEVNDTFDRGYRYGEANAREDDGIDKALNVAMDAGVLQGRKQGERDTYLELGRLLDDPDELIAQVGGRYLAERADLFLLVESARENSPYEFHQLEDAIKEGDEAVAALARRWGVTDDLLDVADAAGVTPLADVAPGELVADLEAWLRAGGE